MKRNRLASKNKIVLSVYIALTGDCTECTYSGSSKLQQTTFKFVLASSNASRGPGTLASQNFPLPLTKDRLIGTGTRAWR